jgi:hypothetical protein
VLWRRNDILFAIAGRIAALYEIGLDQLPCAHGGTHLTCYDAWLTAQEASEETTVVWFPDGERVFFRLRDGIRSGRFRGEQVDHLVWRATVSRIEIETLLNELYGPIDCFETKKRQLSPPCRPDAPTENVRRRVAAGWRMRADRRRILATSTQLCPVVSCFAAVRQP